MRNLEPIFSRQEQAIVYLFSRYWESIPIFKGITISRIHTHFPDFSVINEDGGEEAIEFEYALSAFRSHLKNDCLCRLHHNGVRRLYIVYWEKNDEEDELRAAIRKQARFDLVFVCLKDWFEAEVTQIPGTDGLQTFWRFTDKKRANARKAYSIKDIKDAAANLQSAVDFLKVDTKLYRMLGFNAHGADFIDCDHWEKIHFFTTTTRFSRDRIPGTLLIKLTGCNYFSGYFDICSAFEVDTVSSSVKKFLADYYFAKWAQNIGAEKCFVGNFKRLEYEQGKALYNFLVKKNYRLGMRSSITIGEKDIDKIDSIIAR